MSMLRTQDVMMQICYPSTAARIACLTGREMWNSSSDIFGSLQAEAKRLDVTLIPALLESPYPDDEYHRVFAAMVQDRSDALIVTQLVWNNAHAALIAELAASKGAVAGHLSRPQLCRSGWTNVLRSWTGRGLSPCGKRRRRDPEGRET
jgi:hypothetical protein